MFSKKNLFKLDISGIEFWQKRQDDESNNFQETYRKEICNHGILFLDKMGNPKGLPKTGGCYYMDLVTGRVLSLCLTEDQEHYLILPSMVVIPRNRLLQVDKELYEEAASILVDDKKTEEYTKVSEEIFYDSYFCKIIAESEELDSILAVRVEEAINEIKKNARSEDKKLLKKSIVVEE